MPIYEYRCRNDHTFEVFQSMSEDPVSACVECGATSERVLSAPALHFKGSGFYATDYGRQGQNSGGSESGSESEKGSDKASSEKGSPDSSSGSESKASGTDSKSSGSEKKSSASKSGSD